MRLGRFGFAAIGGPFRNLRSTCSRSGALGVQIGSVACRYRSPLATERAHNLPSAGHGIGRRLASDALSLWHDDSLEAQLTRVEAVLFEASEPLTPRKLANLAHLCDGTQARTRVEELRRRLRQRGSALQPVEVAGGIQLMTRPQLADWLAKLHGHPDELRLSSPALETLAVAAYRQPVVRSEIEAIRGVQCGEMLRMLLERGFLRIVGRSDELGRPMLYGTTRKFLKVFGLRRLEELPPIDQISGTPPFEASSAECRDQSKLAS